MRKPKKLKEVWRRLAFYFRRDRFDRELEAETRFHLEMKTRDKANAGLTVREAEFAARRQFGNAALLHEGSREMWAFRWIDELLQDLRYSFRVIRKSPVLASVIVASLALAIGANTAVFSLVDAVILKMLPVKDPQRLVLFEWSSGPHPLVNRHHGSRWRDPKTGLDMGTSLTSQEFDRMSESNQTLSDIFAFAPIYTKLNVSAAGQSDVATGQFVSGGYYRGLGVNAILGRRITTDDDKEGAQPVAVIRFEYWKKRFQSDRGVLGKPAYVNGVPFIIVGVTPPNFEGALDVGETADISLPLASQPVVDRHPSLAAEGDWWLRIMGRLKPGVSIEQARVNLEPAFQRGALEGYQDYLAKNPQPKATEVSTPNLTAVSGSQGATLERELYSRQLYILLIVVGLVLLIACVNTANLLLARSSARQKEIAVRIAIGAPKFRLIRQLLTESLTLAVFGGLAGFVLACVGKNLVVAAFPFEGPVTLDMSLDFRVLAFAAAISIATGALFGIAPALKAPRVDAGPILKDSSSNQSQGRLRLRLGKALIMVQVALSLVLLVGAGLFIRTLRNLQNVDYGFDAENLLLFNLNPSLNGYKGANLSSLYERISERISGIRGVRSSTMSMYPLLSNSGWDTNHFRIVGAKDQPAENADIYLVAVRNDFLDAMHIPFLLGRNFGQNDAGNSKKVAVINQTLAKLAFKDENPVGRAFTLPSENIGETEIVGVAKDIKYDDLRHPVPPIIFLPYSQCIDEMDAFAQGMAFEVRTAREPTALVTPIREVLGSIDSSLAISGIKTQKDQIDESLGNERLFATFTGALGALALLLSCIGIYGVMSYNVSRRTSEIGIRMALGADATRLMLQVMREILVLVAIGLALGAAGSLATVRVISIKTFGFSSGNSGVLFGVSPHDPVTIVLASLLLLAVAAIAGYVPARRASRVDPLRALRTE